ncbi:MAG: hypothetical protein D6765_06165 [Bacteroidetes bacterium]|nr:MAG: hypothetical protein D6765_06165 [Bacteroidota bacterium]
MQFFEINVAQMVIRFYLMMAVILISFYLGLYWLALLGLPIFLSALLGVNWKSTRGKSSSREGASLSQGSSKTLQMG